MKTIFFVLCSFFPIAIFSQNLPVNEKGKVEFNEKLTINGADQSKLYSICKLFVYDFYENPSDAIIVDDAKLGVLKTTYSTTFTCGVLSPDYSIKFNLVLTAEDNICNLSISNITFKNSITSYEVEELLLGDIPKKKNGELKRPYDCYQTNLLIQVKSLSDSFYNFLVSNINE